MKTHSLLSILVTVAFFGCSNPTELIQQTGNPLDSSVNGKTVIYPPNQSFSLDLEVLGPEGYQWDYTISDPAVLWMYRAPTSRPKDPGPIMPGGSVIETFYFRAGGIGQTTITFIEHQAWMKDVPPLVTVEFTVIVR